eukprot:gene147-397_t
MFLKFWSCMPNVSRLFKAPWKAFRECGAQVRQSASFPLPCPIITSSTKADGQAGSKWRVK